MRRRVDWMGECLFAQSLEHRSNVLNASSFTTRFARRSHVGEASGSLTTNKDTHVVGDGESKMEKLQAVSVPTRNIDQGRVGEGRVPTEVLRREEDDVASASDISLHSMRTRDKSKSRTGDGVSVNFETSIPDAVVVELGKSPDPVQTRQEVK